jgi:hypothetical protein
MSLYGSVQHLSDSTHQARVIPEWLCPMPGYLIHLLEPSADELNALVLLPRRH